MHGAGASAYRVAKVGTLGELEDAARVRWAVFSEAMRLPPSLLPAQREVNGFDLLETTENFICYEGGEAAGTIRLLHPNPDIASFHGVALGLPLEIQFRIEGLPPAIAIAEVGRAAILPRHRGGSAIGRLYRSVYEAARRGGVTHLLIASLTETDLLEDAEIVAACLERLGRWQPEPCLSPRVGPDTPERAVRPIFSSEDRRRAARGDVAGLRLPRTVRFLLGIGLTFVGRPVFEPAFREYMLPALLPLDAFARSDYGRRFIAVGRETHSVSDRASSGSMIGMPSRIG